MGAPIGNKFWELRSKHGVDALFSDASAMWEAACEYFTNIQENPFMAVEQKKGNQTVKIYGKTKDEEYGEMESTVELPRMRPFTIHGLCIYLGVNTKYFNDFYDRRSKKDDQESKDFTEVITRIRETIYAQKFEGAAAGFFNANIISRDLGLADKKEVQRNKIVVTTKKRREKPTE